MEIERLRREVERLRSGCTCKDGEEGEVVNRPRAPTGLGTRFGSRFG